MTKEAFTKLAAEGLVYLDGATGSNLYNSGMPKGVCTEQWVLENPEVIMRLQSDYADAGSHIVYAPTFGCNRASLKKFGLENQVEEMNKRLVDISQKAVSGRVLIAGDMAPTGMLPESCGGEDSLEEIFDVYYEQAKVLKETGIDLFVVETMMSVDETTVAMDAISSVSDLPVMCSLYVNADGRAFYGGTVFEAQEALQAQGVAAVGINCCNGPDQLESIVSNLKKAATVPVIAKPNAGLPHVDDKGQAIYDMGPEEFARSMKKLVEAGAGVIGGCCGTNPKYIRKLRDYLEGRLIIPPCNP